MGDVPLKYVDSVIEWENPVYEGDRQYRRDLDPGSASWIAYGHGNPNAVLSFVCPCGCGSVHAITACQGSKLQHKWLWDGDVERPTLTPSIQCVSPCRWHGFLTGGIFKQC